MERMRKESIEMSVPVSCNKDCGAGCALTAEIRGGRVARIIDNPVRPPFMRGCMKGYRMHDVLDHPGRLRFPLVRTGKRGRGEFRRAGWDEALDLLASEYRRVAGSRGPGSVIRLGGSGSCRGALHNTELLTRRFLALTGGYTDTAGNYSSEASDFVKPWMYGTGHIGIDAGRLEEAAAVVLWGFNPFDTRFGAETEALLVKLAREGMPFYVVDPRKTATVRKLGARWFPVRPGSDGVLFSALIYHITFEKGDTERVYREMERYSSGFPRLAGYLDGGVDGIRRGISWASPLCGLSPEEILELASVFTETRPAALLPGLSIQRTLGGEEADRLAGVLQLVSGNAALPGGTVGSGQWNSLPKPACGRIQVPECAGAVEVPVYEWPDALLEGEGGGYPSSPGFIYCVGGNPVGQGSDLAKSRRAFEQADFSVVHDYFLTETARWADLVLPTATFLEREDICFTSGNCLLYSARAVQPPEGVPTDYEIFARLAERLGFGEAFTEGRTEAQWIDSFLAESCVGDVEAFRREGVWTGKERKRRGLMDFFTDPEAHPLNTPSGKIEIVSEGYARTGGPLYPEARINTPPDGYPLMLITPHEKYRNHSQYDNLPAFKRLCDDRLWIHPADAAARGIGEGDRVVVSSDRGMLLANVRVTGDIARGTVSASQGAWPEQNGETGIVTGNVNVLTSTEPTMPSRGARTHTNFVEVALWTGTAAGKH